MLVSRSPFAPPNAIGHRVVFVWQPSASGPLRRQLGADPCFNIVCLRVRLAPIDLSELVSNANRDGVLIVIKTGAPLKRVLPDGPEEWYECGNRVCLVCRKKFKTRGVTKEFLKAAWLRYSPDRDDYYELPTLETQDQMLNFRQSPAQSVKDEGNANVTTDAIE